MRRWLLTLLGGVVVAAPVLATRFGPPPGLVAGATALVVAGALVRRAAGLHLRRLTLPAVWFLSYVTMVALPAFVVVADKDTKYVGPYLLGVFSALLAVPVGMLIVNAATGFNPREVERFFAASIAPEPPVAEETAAYVLILTGALVLTAGYLIETPVIPLLYLIRNPGSAAVLIGLREESFKLLDSPLLYFYSVLRNVVYPFLIMVSLGYYLTSRQVRWLAIFSITAAVGLFYAAITIAKLPVAVIVLTLVLFVYLYVGGRVSLRAALIGMAAVFVFPVAVLTVSLSGFDVSLWFILKAMFNRLFYLPAEILYNYFVIVPDVLPYQLGGTVGRFRWVLGEPEFDMSNYVFTYMFPERIESGTAPAAFLGYLHADFGLVGILLGGAVVGIILQTIQVGLTRRPKTVVTLAAYAYLMWLAWKLNMESFPQTLLSGGIVVIYLLMGLLRLTQGFLRTATVPPADRPARP